MIDPLIGAWQRVNIPGPVSSSRLDAAFDKFHHVDLRPVIDEDEDL